MANSFARHSDEDLFKLVTQGDKNAFAELYTRFRGRIYAYALRMVGEKDKADDIFQETFTRIYQQCMNSDRLVANAAAYIFTTARNICLNSLRDRKPSTAIEDFHQITFQPNHANAELLELVKTSLELLPDHYREAFILREYDGLSYQEIAEITGNTLPTVKIHIFRAKEKLRKILWPYLEEV